MGIELSVCLIAKNEESHLPCALQSISELASEIILVDTGSTDRTVAIAKEFGAQVHCFPWTNDFSAAYNHGLDQAKGDWILLLDADEALVVESADEVGRCIGCPDVLAYSVLRRDYAGSIESGAFTKMLHVRLFRNRSDLRFVGRIHHQFTEPLESIATRDRLVVRESTIELHHYGYLDSNSKGKLERAAHLMELELQDRPGQFYYLVELGRTWLAMGDERGEELLNKAAMQVSESNPQVLASSGSLAMLLEHILAADQLPEGFALTAEKATEMAASLFPNSIPLLWQRSRAAFVGGEFNEAARLLRQIISLGEEERYDMRSSFDPELLRAKPLLNLGVCYVRLGQLRHARECFLALQEDPIYGQQARANLEAMSNL